VGSLTTLHESGSLHCPYNQCGKKFEKPIVLTDTTKLMRETYYACPHCHCKIDVAVDQESGSVLSIHTAQTPVDMPPAQCKHYIGYLRLLDEEASIPDECAICPKVMVCFAKKSQGTR